MIYRPLMTITGVFVIAVGVLLLIAPAFYISLYLPEFADGMAFAAQRLSPAIMGLGFVLLAARSLERGPFAAKIALISAVVWAGVAATGVFHFVSGTATGQILIAAVTEAILSTVFFVASRQMRNA